MPSKPTPAEKTAEHTFETALARLETIADEMEGEGLPLEGLLLRFEEGTRLVAICKERLEAAEKRVEIITRSAAGEPQLEPFETSAADSAGTAGSKPRFEPDEPGRESVALF